MHSCVDDCNTIFCQAYYMQRIVLRLALHHDCAPLYVKSDKSHSTSMVAIFCCASGTYESVLFFCRGYAIQRSSAMWSVPALAAGGLAFMFETNYTLRLTEWAMSAEHRDRAYQNCWQNMPIKFTGSIS